jgi:hypothetical protein
MLGSDSNYNREGAMKLKRLAVLLAALAVLPEIGSAQSFCRSITSVNVPIMQSGRYCLVGNLFSPTGAGIVIRANNVTIDFQGYRLSTPSNAGSTVLTTGVDASAVQNVTIMNGTIQGYIDGINVGERVAPSNTGFYVITNMRIDRSVANLWRAIGIFGEGPNITVTNNTITNMTGVEGFGIFLHGTGPAIANPGRIVVTGNRIDRVTAVNGNNANGIVLDGGAETIVNDNVVTEIVAGGSVPSSFQNAFGVYVASVVRGGLTEVGGNTVRNSVLRTNSTGIVLNNSEDQVAFVRDSTVTNMNTGLRLGGGCVPFYTYNTIVGATTPYSVSGTPTPCSPLTIDPGPGNRP